MSFLSGTYYTILQVVAVLFGLGLLIFIHELGHFSMAKFYKVRVLKFAFGFGKELWGFTKGETRYSICLFPFGGMVAMAGENPEEATGTKDEFLSLNCFKKVMIVFAGPFMNYVLAFLLFTFCFSVWGIADISEQPIIGALAENQCAQKAGLQVGDNILYIDNIEIKTWNDIVPALKDKANKETKVMVLRGDEQLKFDMIIDENPTTKSGMLGIQPKITKEDCSFNL